MGSSPKAPPPPDYRGLAAQQAEIDRRAVLEQTIANRPNQNTPMGSVQWTRDPQSGQWTQNETWHPGLQQSFDQSLNLQNQALQQAGNLGNQQFQGPGVSPSFQPHQTSTQQFQPSQFGVGQYGGNEWNMQDYGGNPGNLPQYDQASGDEFARMYTESLMNRLKPQQGREQESMDSKLRLQGLQPGTEAYDRAYRNLLTSHGDVNAQAELQGMMAGGQEARNIHQTQMQDFQTRGDQSRADWLARLQGQTAQGEHSRAEYSTGLQGAVTQQQNARDNFQTQLGYDQTMSGLNNYNYQSGLAGQSQQFNQAMQQHLLPWQQAQMMQQMAQGNASPDFTPQGFSQSGASAGANNMGAAQQQYAQQMQQYNEAVAARTAKGSSTGALVGGVAGMFVGNPAAGAAIGGAAGGAMFSDETIKDGLEAMSDEECYEKMKELVPTQWKWTGSTVLDAGVSAQKVAEVFPALVAKGTRGLLQVNYTRLFAILLGAFRHMAAREEAEKKGNTDAT